MKWVEIAKTSGKAITLEVPTDFEDLTKHFTPKAIFKLFMTCFTWKVQGKLGDKSGREGVIAWYETLRKPDPVATLVKTYLSMGMSGPDAEAMVLATLEKIAKK